MAAHSSLPPAASRTRGVGIGTDLVATLVEGLDRPEGVTVDASGGTLHAGGASGQIYRIDTAAATVEVIAQTGRFVLGVCVDGDGFIYACADDVLLRIDPRDGQHEVLVDRAVGTPMALPNYAVFDADGTLFFTDSGDQLGGHRPGRLLMVTTAGEVTQVRTPPLDFPNGLALDQRGVFIAESGTGRVLLVDRKGDTSVFAAGPDGVIDGLAVDTLGGVIASYFQPNRIERFDRRGRREVLLDDPSGWTVLTPTNVTFYGPRLKRMAVASLCGTTLTTMPTAVPGARLSYPAVPHLTPVHRPQARSHL